MRKSGTSTPNRIFTITHLILALILIDILIYAFSPIPTDDIWWHLNSGKYILKHGLYPGSDVFSFTADKPWILHEWLTQVIFAGIEKLFSLAGIRFITGLLTLIFLLLLWLVCRKLIQKFLPCFSDHLVSAFDREKFSKFVENWGLLVFTISAVLAYRRIQARPTLFSIIFVLVFILFLEDKKNNLKWKDLVFLCFLQVIWINLHSIGLLGIVIYTFYFLDEFIKRVIIRSRVVAQPAAVFLKDKKENLLPAVLPQKFAWGFIFIIFASCINPYGPKMFIFALQARSETFQGIEDEWGLFSFNYSHNPHLPLINYILILVISGLFLISLIVFLYRCFLDKGGGTAGNKGSVKKPDLLNLSLMPVIGFFGIALYAQRFFWFLFFPLAWSVGILFGNRKIISNRYFNFFLPVTFSVALFFPFYSTLDIYKYPFSKVLTPWSDYFKKNISPKFELYAISFIKEADLEGNMFCPYNRGGILAYFLWPKVKVFITSDTTLYSPKIFLHYQEIASRSIKAKKLSEDYDLDLYFYDYLINPPFEEEWLPVYIGKAWVYLRKRPKSEENLRKAIATLEKYPNLARPPWWQQKDQIITELKIQSDKLE